MTTIKKEMDFVKRAKIFNKYLLGMGIICLVAAILLPPILVGQKDLEYKVLGADYAQRQSTLERIKTNTLTEERLKQLLFIDERLYQIIFSFMVRVIRFSIYSIFLILAGCLIIAYFHYKRFVRIVEELKK